MKGTSSILLQAVHRLPRKSAPFIQLIYTRHILIDIIQYPKCSSRLFFPEISVHSKRNNIIILGLRHEKFHVIESPGKLNTRVSGLSSFPAYKTHVSYTVFIFRVQTFSILFFRKGEHLLNFNQFFQLVSRSCTKYTVRRTKDRS